MTFNAIKMTLEDMQQSIDSCLSIIKEIQEIEGKMTNKTMAPYNQILDYLGEYKLCFEFERDWK